jgi:hypothetical protein
VIRKPIRITTTCCVPDSVLARNKALAPDLPPPKGSGRLAVVGGGPSVLDRLDELRGFDGEIWAINGAYRFLRSHGIETTFYTTCPGQPVPGEPHTAELAHGAKRAVLTDYCGPNVFAVLAEANVSLAREPFHGPTTAVAATVIGLQAGFDQIVFYGAEGSFAGAKGERCHAYAYTPHPHLIYLDVAGEPYVTKPEFLIQAETLAEIISTFPWTFSEQSGGLLRALITHGQRYRVTHLSRALHDVTSYEAA